MKRRKILTAIACLIFLLNTAIAHKISRPYYNKEFTVKGFHLDLRIQVMKPDALKDLADKLSSLGINTLIMEWEATFPFESHPLIPNKHAYTKEDIAEFIRYCQNLGIDVIPLQQSLGHLEYILRYPKYASIREDAKDVSQICPMESILNKELLEQLIGELAETHPSKYIRLGGDEAYLFGHCEKCKLKVQQTGKATLLAEHLKMVTNIALSFGKIPILWSDVANKYPDQLSQLPKETIFIVWNYGWALDRFGDPEKLTKMGFEVWGAPSLRSNPDNFYLTSWEKHFKNIRDFIPLCRNSGYSGIIMTSWSTSGIYSSVFEDKRTIVDLLPVRHVYPMSGFNILLEAHSESLKNPQALNIEQFIVDYSKRQFGFNKPEALEFWVALKGLPYEVIDGKVENNEGLTIQVLFDSARMHQETMNKLQPSANMEEFEHFRLMKDVRVNYLNFKLVEAAVNSPEYSNEMLQPILNELKEIIQKNEGISKRFLDLNEHLLYTEQINEENTIRIKRVEILYNKLNRNR